MPRTFDLSPLSQIQVSDTITAEFLPPLAAAYAGSLDWPPDRQQAVAAKLALGTLGLIADLWGMPRLTAASGWSAVKLVGWTPWASSPESAANWSARAAWESAESAFWLALEATDDYVPAARAREDVFRRACRLWMEATQ